MQIDSLVAQHKALDFSGRGFRQAVDEFDPARVFPGTDRAFHMHLELFIERPSDIGLVLILEYDEGFWFDQAVFVLDRHDGGLEHFRVGNQCVFDLERRHPNAADLEHVVGAAAVGVNAIRTPQVFVTGAGPVTDERTALIPVADRGRFAAHQQLAHFIVGDVVTVFIDKSEVVAVDRHAGSAVFDSIRKVGQKKMPHLGGADAVDDVEAKFLLPGLADMDRQWFAGREAESNPA